MTGIVITIVLFYLSFVCGVILKMWHYKVAKISLVRAFMIPAMLIFVLPFEVLKSCPKSRFYFYIRAWIQLQTLIWPRIPILVGLVCYNLANQTQNDPIKPQKTTGAANCGDVVDSDLVLGFGKKFADKLRYC